MDTQPVELSTHEYRQISIGLVGSFVNRTLYHVEVVEAATQPSVNVEGDPIVSKRRYHYDLTSGQAIWGKALSGVPTLGVTPQ
ncbi:hypothetical protein [Vibrio penaeicida]|uniref:Uncharacterized protein n=1 Tax=Vibrio penaeicida TaxID=104609 RepID=A0AAV5NSR0_9VIBR|nr:hypothetical protein [Vibrio penaeicida]RTZ22277.1 hypothetical protein EKN09_14820 [Vibrio penaeicida]GLQ73268.1 hypothetical protein GCM10007932_26280 [Vibrio penaeicida]